MQAEADFLEELNSLSALNETVSELSRKMAADFIGLALTNADELIRNSGNRRSRSTVRRKLHRALVSSVGEITFTRTLYKRHRREDKVSFG